MGTTIYKNIIVQKELQILIAHDTKVLAIKLRLSAFPMLKESSRGSSQPVMDCTL